MTTASTRRRAREAQALRARADRDAERERMERRYACTTCGDLGQVEPAPDSGEPMGVSLLCPDCCPGSVTH